MTRIKKLLLFAVGLLVLAVMVNFGTLRDLASGRQTLRGLLGSGTLSANQWDPVGEPSAKVKIQTFAQFNNECHTETLRWIQELAASDPPRLRAEFTNTETQEGKQAAQAVGIGCLMGILINGNNTCEIRSGKTTRVVGFHGPAGMQYSTEDLRTAIAQEFQAAYGVALARSPTSDQPASARIQGRRASAAIIKEFLPAQEAALAYHASRYGADSETIAGCTVVEDHLEVTILRRTTKLARYQYREGRIVAELAPDGTWHPVETPGSEKESSVSSPPAEKESS